MEVLIVRRATGGEWARRTQETESRYFQTNNCFIDLSDGEIKPVSEFVGIYILLEAGESVRLNSKINFAWATQVSGFRLFPPSPSFLILITLPRSIDLHQRLFFIIHSVCWVMKIEAQDIFPRELHSILHARVSEASLRESRNGAQGKNVFISLLSTVAIGFFISTWA